MIIKIISPLTSWIGDKTFRKRMYCFEKKREKRKWRRRELEQRDLGGKRMIIKDKTRKKFLFEEELLDPSRRSRQPNHPYLLILIHCRLYRSALWPSTSRSTETTGSAVDKKSWRSSGGRGVALFLFSSRPCHTSNGIGTSKLPPTFLPSFFFSFVEEISNESRDSWRALRNFPSLIYY